MYKLERYRAGSKHECPACHRQRCFVYYVNDDGTALDPTVGRCDHQSSCGYHLKPREFFNAHPGVQIPEAWRKPAPVEPRKIWTIDKKEVARYRSDGSTLLTFLLDRFDRERVYIVAAQYQLGETRDGSAVFWQIDKDGRVRTGKIMGYHPDGHRIKNTNGDRVNWMHKALQHDGLLPKAFEITQCFFGEHLLRVFPARDVVIVESEKTAVICAITDPTRIFIATGGIHGLNAEKAAALAGRNVTAIPDADAVQEWTAKVHELQKFYNIKIGDPGYTPDDVEHKRDVADLILNQLQK